MTTFIKKIVLFSFGLAVVLALALMAWFQYYSVPPPQVSNNISLSSKAMFLKNNSNTTLDVLTLGSSMSLDNVYSESVTKAYHTEAYINLSCWGIKMEDMFKLLEIAENVYKPKTIIMSGNYMDFGSSAIEIDYNALESYLSSNWSMPAYFKDLKITQLIEDSKTLSQYSKSNTMYNSLNYDPYGAVKLSPHNFNKTPSRWNGIAIRNDFFEKKQYAYLDSIASFCASHNIKFIYVQSPFRTGYYSKINKEEFSILNAHIHTIQSILVKNNAQFINTLEKTWKDSLFVDYTHFNEIGSKEYTDYFLKALQ